MRRKILLWSLGIGASVLVGYVALPIPKEELDRQKTRSIQVLDRNGRLLREALSSESAASRCVSLRDVPKHLIDATIAIEDKNFYSHFGIDFGAVLRALWQNFKAFKIASGASTITQQTARLMLGVERGFFQKLWVTLYALRLEAHWSKEEILTEYFNRAPYGNQRYGALAAAEFYFRKPLSQLTLAECALLAGLPQSPTTYDPLRRFERARKRQEEVLRRMRANDFISEAELRDALAQPLDFADIKRAFHAPHFVDYVLKQPLPQDAQTLITTLDLELQEECERLTRLHLRRLKPHRVANAALVVMENQTGDILAMVGSADYFNADIDGQYNVATGSRQPGSALKPFTYALALEKGLTPSTILPDLPLPFQIEGRYDESSPTGVEMFFPQNFDKKFHGAVRLREALACSYNITAVRALQCVGVESLYQLLKRLGFTTLDKEPTHYGLGLTLGNSDARLIEMVRAYGVFARQGKLIPEVAIKAVVKRVGDTVWTDPKPAKEIFSPQVAYLIADILSDNAARRASFGPNSVLRFPFAVACKTGTTKDYRDNWTFAVSEDFTVGVWSGNSDNEPMRNISGVDGAGALMRDVMLLLSKRYPDRAGFRKASFDMPRGIRVLRVCPISGELAGDCCEATIEEKFIAGKEPKRRCSFHKRFRIDARNGLLATAATPPRFALEKIFVDYPPMYWEWASSQRKPLPPRLFSPLDADSLRVDLASRAIDSLEILFPKSGMIFALDGVLKPEFQRILFSASAPAGIEKIQWKLNGEIIGESAPREKFAWQLRAGTFELEALAGERKSSAVRFVVAD
ncbi:MAG: penicillin-binding protein 1C [Chloroherpetonaceae bacterium]|nr:penicillin-binding protein 1C [Chloroherpetonaceae bacterium]MDW8436788.1 penicillin-binding protein 1C [Chloroherpetonaceae bacterium]